MTRRLLAVLATILLAGCSAAPSPAPPVFASELGVEPDAMVRTASGLLYRDVVAGSGAPAGGRQRVAILYAGWLADGTRFDAHLDRDRPIVVELGSRELIRGLEEGVRGMRVGGQRQLVVPPSLGYGARRVGSIPPGSTLVFLVERVASR